MVKGCSGIYSYDILPISESRLRKAVKEGMGIHQYTHPRFRCPAWLASYTWRFTYYILWIQGAYTSLCRGSYLKVQLTFHAADRIGIFALPVGLPRFHRHSFSKDRNFFHSPFHIHV